MHHLSGEIMSNHRFARLAGMIAACAFTLGAGMAVAQGYPAKTIKLVVPFPPGGSTDIFARTIGNKLSEALKQQVIIDNRPGAGGSIGADAVAKSAPDGYTLLMGHIGTLAVNPAIYPRLPYDPQKDFAPVTLVATVPNILVVSPSLPVNSVAELVAYAKANPGKLSYGSGGNGSAAHIAVELFKQKTGTDIVHIPYKGTAPSVTDVIGGQIAMTMTGAPPLMQFVTSGRLKALGVSSTRRVEALPNVPTIAEAGVKDFEATQWYGIVAPAGTPREIVMRLNQEIHAILKTPEMRERIQSEGAVAAPTTPEEFAVLIKSEGARWGAVVKAAGVKAQ
jgi:tripartite-type tricarboxylate transporter receptor subunit TctC